MAEPVDLRSRVVRHDDERRVEADAGGAEVGSGVHREPVGNAERDDFGADVRAGEERRSIDENAEVVRRARRDGLQRGEAR